MTLLRHIFFLGCTCVFFTNCKTPNIAHAQVVDAFYCLSEDGEFLEPCQGFIEGEEDMVIEFDNNYSDTVIRGYVYAAISGETMEGIPVYQAYEMKNGHIMIQNRLGESDFSGKFELSLKDLQSDLLVFQYIGFIPRLVRISKKPVSERKKGSN